MIFWGRLLAAHLAWKFAVFGSSHGPHGPQGEGGPGRCRCARMHRGVGMFVGVQLGGGGSGAGRSVNGQQ